jgi:hypothetical protein
VEVGTNLSYGRKKFRFEKWWLSIDSFSKIVHKAWTTPCNESKSIDVWQFKMRTLRRMVRGWAMNEIAQHNKSKVELTLEYNHLDLKRESRDLSSSELERLHIIEENLDKIWALEEIKARQRSRDKNVLEGDRNTAYFHAVANHRNRKKKVLILDGPDGPVVEQRAMMEVAVNFYKELFKKEDRPNIHLVADFWSDSDRVTDEENVALTAPFSEVEFKEAIFSCYAEGAPDPDGISFLFYQKFWDLVKEDLINMFNDFLMVS